MEGLRLQKTASLENPRWQTLLGELEFPEPAARILQYYWELQRLRWIDYQRSQQSTLSGESSMIPPIGSQELH